MSNTLNFDLLWAAEKKNLTSHPESFIKSGFDSLGKIAPATGDHDTVLNDIDKKLLFLWRQVRHTCNRYGVDVVATDDETYTNSLADSLTAAIKNQIRSSEANTGIIRIANLSETSEGASDLTAVSPKNLRQVVTNRLNDFLTKNEFNYNWGQLKTIATTGQLMDGLGFLEYSRLSNVPRWIRETHDDGNFFYMRSVDGTQFRIGGQNFDLFNKAGQNTIRLNGETGLIEFAKIEQWQVNNLGKVARDNNYYSLDNLPSLGSSAKMNIFDTGDVNKIPWDGTTIPTTSVARALKDYTDAVKNSLAVIAKSGNLNDGIGVLNKQHGGTGRNDNNIDVNAVVITSSGGNGGIRFDGDSINGGDSNKIVGGIDDGTNIDSMSNLNIDSWNGISFRNSNNNFRPTIKFDVRTGTIRSRGDLRLKDGDRSVISENGALNLVGQSNTISVENDKISLIGHDGEYFHAYSNGDIWIKGNISGGGLRSICFDASLDNTYGSLNWDRVSNKPTLGDSSRRNVYDTLDYNTVPYNGELVSTASTSASIRDGLLDEIKKIRDDILQLMNENDLALTDHSKVGALVIAQRVNGGQQINYPDVTDGYYLRPAACGEYGANMGTLSGSWKCLGASRWSNDPRGDGAKTTLYRRVK